MPNYSLLTSLFNLRGETNPSTTFWSDEGFLGQSGMNKVAPIRSAWSPPSPLSRPASNRLKGPRQRQKTKNRQRTSVGNQTTKGPGPVSPEEEPDIGCRTPDRLNVILPGPFFAIVREEEGNRRTEGIVSNRGDWFWLNDLISNSPTIYQRVATTCHGDSYEEDVRATWVDSCSLICCVSSSDLLRMGCVCVLGGGGGIRRVFLLFKNKKQNDGICGKSCAIFSYA